MRKNLNYYMAALTMALTNRMVLNNNNDATSYNKVIKKSMPWDFINLSKNERKGKTFEEMQDMRKAKWKELREAQPDAQRSDDCKQ